ncbi:MAG: YHYH protein [Polyangiales bacterium]
MNVTVRRRVPFTCLVAALASCADSASSTPDAAAPDAASPDVASPDVAPPDAVSPDAAQGPAARCAVITESIRAAGFADRVTVRCDERYAYLVSDTYPAHVKMDGITGTNDQVPVPAPGYTTPVALAPTRAARPTSIDAALGVAVNGVPIYDYSSQGTLDPAMYDARFDTTRIGELDQCNGHSGRGDDYHYHAAPTCMIAAMRNRGPSAILGWGFDGYPLFGDANPDGSPIAAGALDICNAQPDPAFGFRYHTSAQHPYIMQCLVGAVDLATAPRVPPLSRAGGGGGRPPGEKPPGGVTGLRYVEAADGSRTMTYTHMGRSYSISYRPSATAGCWDFEDQSYTTRGVLQRGTYCRGMR